MTVDSWADLATVALLGTARRRVGDVPLPPLVAEGAAAVPRGEEAERLLDVAALATVYRRAGLRPGPARPLPDPAPDDPRPVVGAAARARLARLLTGAGRDRDLLELWLVTAAERGLRPPAQALPDLLDLAARTRALAPAVLAAAGPRGRWLAQYRPHWAQAAQAVVHLDPADPRGWEHGRLPARLAWLAALRTRDPAAARERLAAGWAREAPGDRAALLGVLADGLTGADEPFLEQGLDDPWEEVRSLAARLLTSLPGSAFARRATERALAAVRAERRLLGRRLTVTLPDPGATVRPARPGGPRSGRWSLLDVVGAAPLATWVPALGRSAAEIAGLEVADGWGEVLWAGWATAARRERDAAWAAALLDHLPPTGRPVAGPHPEPLGIAGAVPDLLALLAAADRARYVAGALAARRPGALPPPAVLLQTVPGPWPSPLAGAVLGWLHRRPELGDPESRTVLDLAARRLPVELAGALRQLAAQWPEFSPGRRLALAAADLMTDRHDLLEELH